MQSFRENFQPISVFYNRWLNGFYRADLLKYKGGSIVGTDYVSRIFQSSTHQIRQKYTSALESTRNPTLINMLADNWQRFAVLNALQRLIVAYQAYPTLKQRFGLPGTFSHTFTEIMNEGLFKGALKGVTLSLLQFSTVMFPAVYLTSKSGSEQKFKKFALNYTIFDTIMYPLDTIKNILYADTLGTMNLRRLISGVSFSSLYSGYIFKMIYNVPLLSGIYCTTQVGKEKEAILSWVAALVLYRLNTLKVWYQVGASEISTFDLKKITLLQIKNNYRGAIPFILMNAFMGWQLRPLFSSQKLQAIKKQTDHQIDQYFGRTSKQHV